MEPPSETGENVMLNFIIAVLVIFGLLAGWIFVQQAARQFAARHPQFGPAKEEGLGCGKNCGCQAGRCNKE